MDELVLLLNSRIDDLKAIIMKKEEQYSSLFKSISKQSARFEAETEDMVTRLHSVKDKRVSEF